MTSTWTLVLSALQILALLALAWAMVVQRRAVRRLNGAYDNLREVLIQAAQEERGDRP